MIVCCVVLKKNDYLNKNKAHTKIPDKKNKAHNSNYSQNQIIFACIILDMKKTGVLLINLGTPDSPKVGSVGTYLFEFLNDPRIIDIPWLLRKVLVNILIVPFRMFSSAKEYQKLWGDKGSPLLYHSKELVVKVQNELGENYGVHLAMRYNKPSIKQVLAEMQKEQYDDIVILPLYPQYASSSGGTAIEEVMKHISKWWVIPNIKIISEFFEDEGYIESIASRAKEFDLDSYDHILFSYHGLPTRHIEKSNIENCKANDCNCSKVEKNNYCYRSNCYSTTSKIAEKLQLDSSKYSICFQSRLNNKWLTPFADKEVIKLAKSGAKKILVFSPAFVADCLETTVEIGEGFKELFIENGGEQLDLVPSLNTHPRWVKAVKDLVVG